MECEDHASARQASQDTRCCGFIDGDENQRAQFVKGIQSALHETILVGYDAQGRYLFIWSDPLLSERYGLELETFVGKSLSDVFPPDEAERRIATTRKIFETGCRHREEYAIDVPTGRYWHDITLAPMRGCDGAVSAVVGVIHDITERKRIQEGLREVDELHRGIVAQVDEAILIHEEGRVVFCNPAAARFFGTGGPEELIGRSAWEFVQPDGYESVSKFKDMTREIFPKTRVSQEISFVTAKGAVVVGQITASWVDYKGNKALLTVIRDMTEEKAAKQRFVRAQKQESLAVLAAGVAHDFNNLLMGILGNASLIRHELADAPGSRDKLDIIERAALRASELTRQLRVFAGDDDLVTENVNLCDLVAEMSELMRVTVPKRVRVEHVFERSDLTVFGDPSQLRQVVMNLLVNASEAIGNRDGRIRIRIGQLSADRALLDSAVARDRLPEGQYNFLEVEDDGQGIDEAAISKIFDPFFTTKFTGRGLGLAAVLGIVQAHGGGVQVASENRRGAVFRVVLPAAERASPRRFSSAPAARPSRPGRGRVLIADEDGTVRDVLRATLEISGFEVLVATDGGEALRAFEENEDIVIAVIDVTTPYVGGNEVIAEFKRRRPGLPAILLSCSAVQGALGVEEDGVGPDRHLEKPFFPGELMALVDELTGAPAASDSAPSPEE